MIIFLPIKAFLKFIQPKINSWVITSCCTGGSGPVFEAYAKIRSKNLINVLLFE
jgi:hypothetical protein